MEKELNTYQMVITVKSDDRMGNLRNWVTEAIWSGLDGTKFWYLNGKQYTKEKFLKKLNKT